MNTIRKKIINETRQKEAKRGVREEENVEGKVREKEMGKRKKEKKKEMGKVGRIENMKYIYIRKRKTRKRSIETAWRGRDKTRVNYAGKPMNWLTAMPTATQAFAAA